MLFILLGQCRPVASAHHGGTRTAREYLCVDSDELQTQLRIRRAPHPRNPITALSSNPSIPTSKRKLAQ